VEISVEHLSFSYPETPHVQIFCNTSVRFASGRISAVVGRSGSGKSTLLRLLTGLTGKQVQHDRIFYGPNKLSPAALTKDGRLSLCFQTPACLPWATVYDNVTLPFRLQNKCVDHKKACHLLELFGLGYKYKEIYPNTLSIGMQSRVALARAFVTSPDVVLLDEPFASLDVFWKAELYTFLCSALASVTCTVVLVTHDILEAFCIADDIYILSPDSHTLTCVPNVNLNRFKSRDKGSSPSIASVVSDDQFPQLFNEVCKALGTS
jgi:NitT/TauT family transport system ATP-binding protein